MNPELQQAIKERIDLGHSQEQIAAELRAAGYDDETIDVVYTAVSSGVSPIPAASSPLPPFTELCSQTLTFLFKNPFLVFLALIPAAAVTGVVYGFENEFIPVSVETALVAAVGYLLLLLVQIWLQATIARTALSSTKSEADSIGTNMHWVLANFGSVLWVSVLSYAVIFGGLVFLFIPGIVAMVYLLFALYVYLDEGITGMAALERTHQLVQANVWGVLGRLLLFLLVFLGLGFVVGFVYGVVEAASSVAGVWIAMVLDVLVTGLAAVFSVGFTVALYQALKVSTPSVIVPPKNTWYRVLGWIGAVAIVLFVSLTILGIVTSFDEMLAELSGENEELESLVVPTREFSPAEQAEIDAFLEQHGGDLVPRSGQTSDPGGTE